MVYLPPAHLIYPWCVFSPTPPCPWPTLGQNKRNLLLEGASGAVPIGQHEVSFTHAKNQQMHQQLLMQLVELVQMHCAGGTGADDVGADGEAVAGHVVCMLGAENMSLDLPNETNLSANNTIERRVNRTRVPAAAVTI